MSFLRHGEIYQVAGVLPRRGGRACVKLERKNLATKSWAIFGLEAIFRSLRIMLDGPFWQLLQFLHRRGRHPSDVRAWRLDESPVGYSLAGYSPAEPTSASPTGATLQQWRGVLQQQFAAITKPP